MHLLWQLPQQHKATDELLAGLRLDQKDPEGACGMQHAFDCCMQLNLTASHCGSLIVSPDCLF